MLEDTEKISEYIKFRNNKKINKRFGYEFDELPDNFFFDKNKWENMKTIP